MYDFAYWSLLPALLDGKLNEDVSRLISSVQQMEACVELFKTTSPHGWTDLNLDELMTQLYVEKLRLLQYSCEFVKSRLLSAKKVLLLNEASATKERCAKLQSICEGLLQQIAKELFQTAPEETNLLMALKNECLEVGLMLTIRLERCTVDESLKS
mmetsp:Transcript_725/g.1399  ORF Transcript_725/g.1399 Transcript_725/m.1399 type:complete len:156 (+) Transcript_725:3007-3474(+)